MAQKHEWRKKEKALYLAKVKPELVDIPTFNFITLSGEGSPNNPSFSATIMALYKVAYTIKMQLKAIPNPPPDYQDYTVYPLEGIWDINETAKQTFNGVVNKDDLVFKLMLRQPNFVDRNLFMSMLTIARESLRKNKQSTTMLDNIRYEQITEGKCLQMLHIGRYEDENISFQQMEQFAEAAGLTRLSKTHREIYLSDFRKVAPEKLKTVLRFNVGH